MEEVSQILRGSRRTEMEPLETNCLRGGSIKEISRTNQEKGYAMPVRS